MGPDDRLRVASNLPRSEAEDEARRRNHDPGAPPAMTIRLGPAEVATLQAALDTYMAFRVAGHDHDVLERLHLMFLDWQGDGR